MSEAKTTPAPELPRFGRFQATAVLGTGAMGTVYRAHDARLRREIAIKTIRAMRGSDELTARFQNEARAVGALAHPNIIAVYDIDLDAETPYLVLELAAGGSLKKRLEQGPLDVATVRTCGIQIAHALAAAHEQRILHRDVKPANLLETEPGTFKLADFGIAHVPDSTLTVTGMFLGSPAYAAPESLARGEFSPASDVHGLAATLYELLTGEPPYGRGGTVTTMIAAHQQGPRPLPDRAQVPSDLAGAILRALAREPSARPSATAFAHALANTSASMPAVAAASSMSMASLQAPGSRGRRRALAIAAAAVLGLLLVGIVAATSGDESSPGAHPPAGPADPIPAAFAEDDEATDDERARELEEEREEELRELETWPEERGRGHFKGKGRGKGRKRKH